MVGTAGKGSPVCPAGSCHPPGWAHTLLPQALPRGRGRPTAGLDPSVVPLLADVRRGMDLPSWLPGPVHSSVSVV